MNATATHTTRWAQYLAQAQALTPPKRPACSATATS